MKKKSIKLKTEIFTDEEYLGEREISFLLELGTHLHEGSRVLKKDDLLAMEVLGLAVEYGNEQAMNNYGWLLMHGEDAINRDIALAKVVLEEAANLGYAPAMVNLGNIYDNTNNCALSTVRGHKKIDNVIYLDENTSDVEIEEYLDHKKAAEWYRKAAALGDIDGIYSYAEKLRSGEGVRKNYKKAFELFSSILEEASSGYNESAIEFAPAANYYLGLFYANGYGVKRDYKKAHHYYMAGAASGDYYCYNNLGMMYLNGKGVKKDYRLAMKYFVASAEQGAGLSMKNIGQMYESGQGVEPDKAIAGKWYEKAIAAGEETAIEDLERVKTGTLVYN